MLDCSFPFASSLPRGIVKDAPILQSMLSPDLKFDIESEKPSSYFESILGGPNIALE